MMRRIFPVILLFAFVGVSFAGTSVNDSFTLGPNPASASFGGSSDGYYFRGGKNINDFSGGVFTNFDAGIASRAMVSVFSDTDGNRGVNLVSYGANNTTHGWSKNAVGLVAESLVSGLYLATNGASPVRVVINDSNRAEFDTLGRFSLVSDALSQPTVNLAPPNTFGTFANISGKDGTGGGLNIVGLSASDERGLLLQGVVGATDPTDATPAVLIRGSKSNGSGGTAALGASETVFAIQNQTGLYVLRINGAGYLGLAQNTPASSSASCSAGQMTADANYIYACTATNTWKRSALSSW